ncbi:DUF551 domain-containing protein [Pseudomonas sp. BF-R-01]|uniref:DUF551 domain-containing protein n=1 Tax=Pseudomonas sp. BF-R-01 TaxID=2832365 RepID=UPI001CC15D14
MSCWISIEESLPVPNKKVLVCRVGKTSYPPFMAIRRNRDQKPWEYIDGDTCHTRITHWFPIPDMPK